MYARKNKLLTTEVENIHCKLIFSIWVIMKQIPMVRLLLFADYP